MAIRMMLVGVDTFSFTLNRRLSTEKELRREKDENDECDCGCLASIPNIDSTA